MSKEKLGIKVVIAGVLAYGGFFWGVPALSYDMWGGVIAIHCVSLILGLIGLFGYLLASYILSKDENS